MSKNFGRTVTDIYGDHGCVVEYDGFIEIYERWMKDRTGILAGKSVPS